MNREFGTRANLSYATIIVTVVLNNYISNKQTFIFALSWILLILLMGNITRLKKTNRLLYIIRMILYFFPFSFPYFICLVDYTPNTRELNISILLVLFLAISYFLIQKKKFRLLFSDINVASLRKYDITRNIMLIINTIGAAICEELYFRAFIIQTLSFNYYLAIVVSVIFFVTSHYMMGWNNYFKYKDYIAQSIVSIISGTVFCYCQSVIPCILLHIIYNCPQVILELLRFKRFFINPQFYDKLLYENEKEFDLTI